MRHVTWELLFLLALSMPTWISLSSMALSSGGASPPSGPPIAPPNLNFSNATNSMYVSLVFG